MFYFQEKALFFPASGFPCGSIFPRMKRVKKKFLVLLLFVGIFIVAQASGVTSYLRLDFLKEMEVAGKSFVEQRFFLSSILFFFFYVIATGLSIPGAAIFTLAAGTFFGLFWGTVLVSFSSTLGASFSFLLSRYLFREWVEITFQAKYQNIAEKIEMNPIETVAFLRLAPVFPFFLVNVLCGISPISLKTYYWVSQLCMLPATILFVNAGSQLSLLNDPKEIISFKLIVSFTLLGVFPIFMKWIYKKWKGYT